jgi:hypothetical protein
MLYASQDWLGDNLQVNKFTSSLKYGFSGLFVLCDYIGAKYTTILLNHTVNLQVARNSFWGHRLNSNEYIYNPDFAINYHFSNLLFDDGNEILFIGNCNSSSSIDKILNCIENSKYVLTIIGPVNDYLNNIVKIKNKKLKILGPLKRSDFKKYSKNCFMGINIISDGNSHSKYAIQSKTIDYLKLGLPILVTNNLGVTAEFVEKYQIGRLLDQNVGLDKIRDAIDDIYSNKQYKENIINISNKYNFSKISEFLV